MSQAETSLAKVRKGDGRRARGNRTGFTTGACAAAVIGISQGKLKERVTVSLPGGKLTIAWKGPGQPVYMTGPAEHVFDGQIEV